MKGRESGMGSKVQRRKDRSIIMRDLLIFQLKLFLDGLKDVVISPLAIGAAALDILAPTSRRGARFYAIMRAGERVDRWLNLFGASEAAASNDDGLFGASRAGSDTMLGKLEAYVLGHEEPEEATRKPAERYDSGEVLASR